MVVPRNHPKLNNHFTILISHYPTIHCWGSPICLASSSKPDSRALSKAWLKQQPGFSHVFPVKKRLFNNLTWSFFNGPTSQQFRSSLGVKMCQVSHLGAPFFARPCAGTTRAASQLWLFQPKARSWYPPGGILAIPKLLVSRVPVSP